MITKTLTKTSTEVKILKAVAIAAIGLAVFAAAAGFILQGQEIKTSNQQISGQLAAVSLTGTNLQPQQPKTNQFLANLGLAPAVEETSEQRLERVKKAIQEKGGLWQAVENKFSNKSLEELRKLLGVKPPDEVTLKQIEERQRETLTITAEDLPDFFDWRSTHGQDYTTRVKDQSSCGSCWAFGAVATLEGSINAYYNNPDLNIDLSEQDLVSCFHGQGCNGATTSQIENLFKTYYPTTGIATETCFSYTATNNMCSNKCPNWQELAWKTNSYIKPELTPEAIKKAIMENGPLETVMAVYDDFYSYSSGIYQHFSDELLGYHAITLVGFGKYDGMDYWIAKNSWGTNWGENGYFNILVGDSMIDSYLVLGVANPKPSTIEPPKQLCFDQDQDGYCSWGISSSKPADCPLSCEEQPTQDCNDSQSEIFQNCGQSTEPTGILSVASEASGADVFVKDLQSGEWIYRGLTPIQFKLNIGQRQIKITKKFYGDYTATIEISPEQVTPLNIVLTFIGEITNIKGNDVYRLEDQITIRGIIGVSDYILEWSRQGITDWSNVGITKIQDVPFGIETDLAIWDSRFLAVKDYYFLRLRKGEQIVQEIRGIYFAPLRQGWPVRIEINQSMISSPVVANVNQDEAQEIVVSFQQPDTTHALAILAEDGTVLETLTLGKSLSNVVLPVISDLDGDGTNEIITYNSDAMNENGYLYIFAFNGSGWSSKRMLVPFDFKPTLTVADLNNDGKKEIIIKGNQVDYSWHEPQEQLTIVQNEQIIAQWDLEDSYCAGGGRQAVGNFDEDNDLEIVVTGPVADGGPCTSNNKGVIYVYNMDGSKVNGWPRYTVGLPNAPVVADINNDGQEEILVSLENIYNPKEPTKVDGGIYLFNRDGIILWSVLTNIDFGWNPPAVADINQDGFLEIAVGIDGINGQIYLLNHEGVVLKVIPKSNDYAQSVLLVDIVNQDNFLELIGSSGGWEESKIWAWDKDGLALNDFTKIYEGGFDLHFTISDLDNNGELELIAVSNHDFDDQLDQSKRRGSVFVWNLNTNYNEFSLQWPTFQHDVQRTGRYIKPVPSILLGDINQDGKIDSRDWILMEKFLRHVQSPTPEQKQLADLNANQKIDRFDWVALQKLLEGKIQQKNLPLLLGDADDDGKVHFADITTIEMMLQGQGQFSEKQKLQADANANKRIDKHDIKLLESVMVGTIKQADLPLEPGDFDDNDQIKSNDVIKVMKYLNPKNKPTPLELLYGDMNLNGKFDQPDLDQIQKMATKYTIEQECLVPPIK
ncbi:MAG: C1 family peptidase [Candidatus Jacksonbacteria bacterium]